MTHTLVRMCTNNFHDNVEIDGGGRAQLFYYVAGCCDDNRGIAKNGMSTEIVGENVRVRSVALRVVMVMMDDDDSILAVLFPFGV